MGFDLDVVVIGGGGHVGLPLSMLFAETGLSTAIIDTDPRRVDQIRSGVMPFAEEGAPEMLARTVKSGMLTGSTDAARCRACRFVV